MRPDRRRVLMVLAGSLIQAFGICNIHALSNITEGGTIGLTLLLRHWTGISPAVTSFLLNGLCFFLGWRTFGKEFLFYTGLACASYSVFYALLEPFAPLFPFLLTSRLLCAVTGAVFVGIGAGLAVRAGGAISGDDALAMSLSSLLKRKIQTIYLVSDLTVLLLSLTYIPLARIAYSLITVILSGQIIGWMQRGANK